MSMLPRMVSDIVPSTQLFEKKKSSRMVRALRRMAAVPTPLFQPLH